MLVITEIKVVEVPKGRDTLQLAMMENIGMIFPPDASEPIETEVLIEHVKGQRFHCNGNEYIFGWSKQVQEALRIPMSAFTNMSKEIDNKQKQYWNTLQKFNDSQALVKYYQNIPWYTRLWNVFVGN